MTNSMAVLAGVSVVLGAIVGSFLNACIHRLPRGISLSNPRRSFCPACNKLIPWYENIPLVSWLVLRGKCSGCGANISPRYVFVEALTAVCFLFLWLGFGYPLGVVYWVFVSLMIAATFIDIEHFIIPDRITWGGMAAGWAFSLLVPGMMDVTSRWEALGRSVLGAAVGYGLLWLVVQGGKLAFGRKKHTFPKGEIFRWVREGDRADIFIGEEKLAWEDIFSRESDALTIRAGDMIVIDGKSVEGGEIRFRYDTLTAHGADYPLDTLGTVTGHLSALVIPREAMGFGDVKFIACIGAFLGWQAVLFTIFSSSIIGCVAGLGGIFLAKDRSGSRLPFGPFLALGAVIWLFGGRELTAWYMNHCQFLNNH